MEEMLKKFVVENIVKPIEAKISSMAKGLTDWIVNAFDSQVKANIELKVDIKECLTKLDNLEAGFNEIKEALDSARADKPTEPVTGEPPVVEPEKPPVVGPVVDPNIGIAGYVYGSDYFADQKELPGGEAEFIYFGNEGASYPEPNPVGGANFTSYTDESVRVAFPSHAVNYVDDSRVSLSYEVYDADGNVILSVNDTKSGFVKSNKRANTHPDFSNRWIKKGVYQLLMRNDSEADNPIYLESGTTKKVDKFFAGVLERDETRTIELDYRENPEGTEWHSYKIRANRVADTLELEPKPESPVVKPPVVIGDGGVKVFPFTGYDEGVRNGELYDKTRLIVGETDNPDGIEVCVKMADDSFGNAKVYAGLMDEPFSIGERLDVIDMEGFVLNFTAFDGQWGQTGDNYSDYIVQLGNPKEAYEKDGMEYAWYPALREPQGPKGEIPLLPTFYDKFPKFNLAEGVISGDMYVYEDDPDGKSIEIGGTHSLNRSGREKIYFDYEAWLKKFDFEFERTEDGELKLDENGKEIKLPNWPHVSGGAEAKEIRKKLLDQVDLEKLKQAFVHAVALPTSGYGIVILNFEDTSGVKWHWKLYEVIKSFKENNQNTLLGIYSGGQGGVFSLNWKLENANAHEMTPDLLFEGNFGDWIAQRVDTKQTAFQANYQVMQLCDIFFTNDHYITRYVTTGWLHQYLMMVMMNKKFFPDKKFVMLLTHLVENTVYSPYVADMMPVEVNGEILQFPSKPCTPAAMLFTAGLVTTSCGHGNVRWNNPEVQMTNAEYHDRFVKDVMGGRVKANFKKWEGHGTPGAYVLSGRPQVGLDWEKAGEWRASQFTDIIEADTEWVYLDYKENGKAFTGNDCLPSETLVRHHPVIRGKLSADGKEVYVIVSDNFANPLKKKTHEVNVFGTWKKIESFGNFGSGVRVKMT